MKKFYTVVTLLLLSVAAMSQTHVTKYNYKFDKFFPNDTWKKGNGGHGVAVDPAGKVWFQYYSASDSILNTAGKYTICHALYVYNPDGTPASFSPIKTATIAGVTDTLGSAMYSRGVQADANGNVVAAFGNVYYRFNYKTGAAMNKLAPTPVGAGLKPAFTSANEMATGYVLPNLGGVSLWDKDFNSIGSTGPAPGLDTTKGYSRTVSISKDGNDVYFCSYAPMYVLKVHSDNGTIGPYSKIDSLFTNNLAVESIEWHPKTGYLWVSSGNLYAPSNKAKYTDFTYYAFKLPDFTTPVDSFSLNCTADQLADDPRPRGIAFSPTGDTVYTCTFNSSLTPIVQRFIKSSPPPVTTYSYKFEKSFPDDTWKKGNGGHGVAVDPAGKVWFQYYSASDSILNTAGKYTICHALYVYNPDGTPASFSPIKIATISGVTDTLGSAMYSRGVQADANGNIVAAFGTVYYRFNYKTGAAMNKLAPTPVGAGLKPAFTSANEMATGYVLPNLGGVSLWDKDFNSIGSTGPAPGLDTTKGYSRTVSISKDGNDVYFCSYAPMYVLKVHSDNGTIGPYYKIDTLFKNLAIESIDWHPKTGYLWVSSGNLYAPCGPEFTNFSYYAFKAPDFTSPVDSFQISATAAQFADDPRPRGIAFSPTGDTVYTCTFNSSLTPIVQRFIGKSSSGVARRVDGVVVKDYQLTQNYPNPFNPSTTINFSLPVASNVTLKVYNMLGAEVATVAQGFHVAGSYNVRFDASNLASGVYIYTLRTSTGFVQSNKMLLMK